MKKLSKIALMAALVAVGFSSCSDDNENKQVTIQPSESITYSSDDIWTGWNKEGNLVMDNFKFSHIWTDFGTYGMSQGFVAAKIEDNAFHDPMFDHQFEVITGGGVDGVGSPYLVANWNSSESSDIIDDNPPAEEIKPDYEKRSCHIARTDGATFTPVYVYATNAAYAYYSMLNGDNIAKKFSKGDYLILEAHGVMESGAERTAKFYLANCTGENAADGILKKWEVFDLSSLGTVKAIYFTMVSSDNGKWGMNTPAYFALDKFVVK